MNDHQPSEVVNSDSGLENLVRGLLVLTMAIAAALTVVTHIAQIIGISFRVYTVIGICAVIGVIFVCRKTIISVLSRGLPRSLVALALLICCIIGSVLSLVSRKVDADDSLYIPNVVYYLENPDKAMGFDIHFIDSGAEPFVSYHIGTSLPFEYTQGIVAYLTGVSFINIYYLVVPAFFSFLIPLGWFYLITRFSYPQRAAVVGTFFIILTIILMGQERRSPGNFAFNRIHQGKTVMLTIGISLFAALTMDFFREASMRRWKYLFVTAFALVGFTASSCVVIPLLAFVLAIACCVWYVRGLRRCLWRGFWYFCHLIYPGIYAISILLFSMEQLNKEAPINKEIWSWSLDFIPNMRLVFNDPAVILFSVSGTVVAVIFLHKRERNFLITWIVLLILFYLNPVVSPLLIEYVTSPNVYWRLIYLLPIPLVVGLSGAAIKLRLESQNSIRQYIIFSAMVSVLVAAHLPKFSPSVFRHGTRLSLPRPKVPLALAKQVLSASPPAGTMLASPIISSTLPMLTSKYPQMIGRTDGIGICMYMSQRGPQVEAEYRLGASYLLAGKTDPKGARCLGEVINRHPQIRSIVARRFVEEDHNENMRNLMRMIGFTESKTTDNVVIFTRPTAR